MTTQKQCESEEVRHLCCGRPGFTNTIEELVEKHAVKQSVSRIEELVKIFIHATKVRSFDCVASLAFADSI